MAHVRAWKRSDLAAIQNVAWETWDDAYGAFIPEADRKFFHEAYYALNKLRNLYDSKVVEGCVAVANKQVVGYSKTYWNSQRAEFFITSLYVLPEFQKLGLGKQMLEFGMEAAQAYGVDRIWLGVMIDNKPALDWYRRQGFLFVESRPFTIGKTTIDDLIGYKLIEN
ncbi:MAG: GNAT family N-acetyltransferase [Candidatus Marinimicrobia bacterium]|nr:GNAT family N-acetyltransferase [Candidatus Neomarinimicrobiota bacterium]MCF7905410.1 GNAT family N-acetyltransferase [Candidatus Neomarinimicrobiota bacterium]